MKRLKLLQPLSHELGAEMNVDLSQTSGACVGELVRNAGSDDHDLAANRFYSLGTRYESRASLHDHEYLFIRMPVKAGAFTGPDIYEDERHGAAAEVDSLQLRFRQVLAVDNEKVAGRRGGHS